MTEGYLTFSRVDDWDIQARRERTRIFAHVPLPTLARLDEENILRGVQEAWIARDGDRLTFVVANGTFSYRILATTDTDPAAPGRHVSICLLED